MKLFVTGITGTVGAALLPVLVRRHQLVCLVRGDNPSARLKSIIPSCDLSNVVAVSGDITQKNLGLRGEDCERARNVDAVLHIASSVRFEESLKEETALINIHGTRNVLDFASLKTTPVHYVSTAYVAGSADRLDEDEQSDLRNCRNPYERTKLCAERLVTDEKGPNCSVYRLGIIVGNSQTGEISDFSAYYGFYVWFWKLFQEIKDCVEQENDQKMIRFVRQGATWLPETGMVSLPIFLGFGEGTLNLVPIDWLVETLDKLIVLPQTGATYHLTHPNPCNIRWLNSLSLSILGFCDFSNDPLNGKPTVLQRIYDSGTGKLFRPYITHEAKFGTAVTQRVLGSEYVSPPDINETLIRILLKYAVKRNLGL